MRLPKVIVIGGPSGSGKTTVLELLEKQGLVRRGVTCTTRPPRPGEVDGRDYDFLTPEEFERLDKRGALVEKTVYIGNPVAYGISLRRIHEVYTADKPTMFILDSVGLQRMRELVPETVGVALLTTRNMLVERMQKRGESSETIDRRLARYGEEVGLLHRHFDWEIVTDGRTPEEVAALAMRLSKVRERA